MAAEANLDQLVEQITDHIIARLNQNGGQTPFVGCSTDVCLSRYPEQMRSAIAAGASRLGFNVQHPLNAGEAAAYIDHTILKPEATFEEIKKLCSEARTYGFASVCINPTWVRQAAELLQGSNSLVCTVVGFPLGANTPDVKAFETRRAIFDGAREIDMVINIGALKSGNDGLVEADIRAVVEASHEFNCLVKVIIECALLTDEEKVKACVLAKSAGADYVKTSTGFSKSGATAEDVALMRRAVGPEIGVKAAGGVRDYESAEAMIKAGATRIGASVGVKIVQEVKR